MEHVSDTLETSIGTFRLVFWKNAVVGLTDDAIVNRAPYQVRIDVSKAPDGTWTVSSPHLNRKAFARWREPISRAAIAKVESVALNEIAAYADKHPELMLAGTLASIDNERSHAVRNRDDLADQYRFARDTVERLDAEYAEATRQLAEIQVPA